MENCFFTHPHHHPTHHMLWAIALRSPYPTLRSGQAGASRCAIAPPSPPPSPPPLPLAGEGVFDNPAQECAGYGGRGGV